MLLDINKARLDKERQESSLKLAKEIKDCIAKYCGASASEYGRPFFAYIMYKVKTTNKSTLLSRKLLESGSISLNPNLLEHITFITQTNNKDLDLCLEKLTEIMEKAQLIDLALVTLMPIDDLSLNNASHDFKTPISIANLSVKLLDLKEGDKFADLGCGYGTVLLNSILEEEQASFFAFDINQGSINYISMINDILDNKIKLKCCNALSLLKEKSRFDKIFFQYPLGIRSRHFADKYLSNLEEVFHKDVSKIRSTDWLFNALICSLLKKNGIGIGLSTTGSLLNGIDRSSREIFVSKKLIKCIIALPNNMFSNINVGLNLVIFSNSINDSIRMIDASNIYQKGRRVNTFNENDIESILKVLQEDCSYSKDVSLKEIEENDYNLSATFYTKEEIFFENAVPLSNVLKDIVRGVPFSAKDVDKYITQDKTNLNFLALSNIKNGVIDKNLPYLSCIESKHKKYTLENNNLIISKSGFPYKTAVANIEDGKEILVSGILYILKLDETKINPYYLKAFFDSEKGQTILKESSVGTTLITMAVDALKKIKIPLPNLEVQNAIGAKYKENLEKVSLLQDKLNEAISRLSLIFDEGL